MSFRYTNNLVGVLKHRLLLESSFRELTRRRFTGTCRGVEVVCSGHGAVLSIRLLDKAEWEPFYRKTPVSMTPESSDPASKGTEGQGPLALDRLAESAKAAVWDATRKIRAAKEAAHQRSLAHNPQLQAHADLRLWYEQDANTMRPHAFDALRHEAATPWVRLVQRGMHGRAAELMRRGGETNVKGSGETGPEDCDPENIPIGSAHPLLTPGLMQLECTDGAGQGSRIDDAVVRQEQWREMSRDELLFWERVELIRKGQLATIKDGSKRPYVDQTAVVNDNVEDKVQLRFTQ